MRARYDPHTVVLEPLDPTADVRALGSVAGIDAVHPTERGYAIVLDRDTDVSETLGRIVASAPPRHLELVRPRLEDVFLSLVMEKSRMMRVLHVARREFLSTVLTKGFIIGILLTPCLVAGVLVLMPALMSESAPAYQGPRARRRSGRARLPENPTLSGPVDPRG